MSTLQMEFMETIEGLSDDIMRILLEVVKQVVLPLDHKESVGSSSEHQSKPRRMGSLKGQRLIAEGYDWNDVPLREIWGDDLGAAKLPINFSQALFRQVWTWIR